MTVKMTLEGVAGMLDLNAQHETGKGVQVHAGVVGMGLPPVAGQWLEGAGDGALYRGGRVLTRDIDLPVSILAESRTELIALQSKLAFMFSDEAKLTLVDTDSDDWYLMVRRVGGGNWVYGHDTNGEAEVHTVVTVRAGDPYWTSSLPKQAVVTASTVTEGMLLSSLATFKLAPSQAIGTILLDNSLGDAPAYPSWVIEGPGNTFRAESPTGEVLQWNGVINAGQKIVIDSRFGRVYDFDTRQNLYNLLAPAPRFWAIPPGTSRTTASLNDPGVGTKITCTWRPRKWAVV